MFDEYYAEFKALYKKWIILQFLCDVVYLTVTVVTILKGNHTAFWMAMVLFFFAQWLVVKCLFGSRKAFVTYLNVNGKYQQALKSGDEASLSDAQQNIIAYMKEKATNK